MANEDDLQDLRKQLAALTRRVYLLEQRAQVAPVIQAISATPQRLPSQMPPAPAPGTDTVASPAAASTNTLEQRIGTQWLNRIGIIAVLVGVSYFLKLAFENNWVGPGLRVLVGLVAGIAVVLWSERFRKRGVAGFSYSLKAVGIGILYLSLWASYQAYQLVPSYVAFAGMVLVTAATTWMALQQNTEVLAALALLGGFLTPVLISSGKNQELALFSYVVLLDLGALILQRFQLWPRILAGAWLGSLSLYFAWHNTYYTNAQYGTTIFFVSTMFLIFAVAPLISAPRTRTGQSLTTFLSVLNALFFFLQVRQLMTGVDTDQRSAAYAIGLAALYFGLALALRRREVDLREIDISPSLIHYGLATAFLTLAIALKLSGKWMTLGWLVEGTALFYAGLRSRRSDAKIFGAIVLALTVFRLVIFDSWDWHTNTLIFNERFGLYLLTFAALAYVLWSQSREANYESIRPVIGIGIVIANIVLLLALNLEVSDYFRTAIQALQGATVIRYSTEYRSLHIIRDFSYSAVWMVYGVALMWVGFWKRVQFFRWMAIVLIAATVLKVFIYDVSALDRVYRILSFIILGVILLAISYAYQKDWLKVRS